MYKNDFSLYLPNENIRNFSILCLYHEFSERRKQDDAIAILNKGLKEAEEVQEKYEQYSTGLKREIEDQTTEISALRESLILHIVFQFVSFFRNSIIFKT